MALGGALEPEYPAQDGCCAVNRGACKFDGKKFDPENAGSLG